jgi:hypothetical protein
MDSSSMRTNCWYFRQGSRAVKLAASFWSIILRMIAENRRGAWLAMLIVLGAFALRVRDQAHVEFWTDEAVSVQHVRAATWPALVDSLARNEGMPVLYFALARLWSQVADSEIGLRLLSLWLGALTVALSVALGRRCFHSTAGGLWLGALTGISSLFVVLAQWARPYSLALCLTMALLLLTLRLGGPRARRRDWALYWLCGAAAMYTLYTLGFVLVGSAAYLAYRRYRLGFRPGLAPIAASGLAILAACLPWVPILLHQGAWAPRALWWVQPPEPRLLLETLDQFVFGTEVRGWPRFLTLLAVPLLAVGLMWGAYQAARRGRLAFPLLNGGLPLALFWLLSYRTPIYVPRHAFFAAPGCLLLLTEALAAIRAPARTVLGLSLLAGGLAAQFTPLVDSGLDIPWSQVAAYLARQAGAHELVIFSPPFQQPAFEIKYQGAPLDLEGIGQYEAYTHRPDAVFDVRVPLARAQAWTSGRQSFWLIEDSRWPVAWGRWEFKATGEMKFQGVTVYHFQRVP